MFVSLYLDIQKVLSESIHIGTMLRSDSRVYMGGGGGGGARGQNLELLFKLYFQYFSLQPYLEIIHT